MPAASEDALLAWRKEFPILANTTYLISNSLGAMPRATEDALHEYAEIWNTRGVRAWEEKWWMFAAEIGDLIGGLLNAPKGTVSCHQNVTQCQQVIASCLDFSGKRNKVVYSDLNFPSVMYLWEAQRALGARIEMVPTDGVHVPLERMLDAIDEQTLIVPMSHVIFRSSFLQDAKAIIDKAHRVGALVLLDCFQSLGCVPVGCAGLQRGLRHRRSSQMAVRRAGHCLSLCASRSRGPSCSRALPDGRRRTIRSLSRPVRSTTPPRNTAS